MTVTAMRTRKLCSSAAFSVLLLGAFASPAFAQVVAADCPFRYTLPAGWARVPLLSKRVDPESNLRFSYGAGAEDVAVLSVGVRGASTANMERSAILTNKLMVETAPITVGGTPAQVLHAPNRNVANGQGGSDAWQLFLPFGDDQVLVIRFTVVAGRGVTPPSAAVIRKLLSSLVPGACLRDEPG